jgi:O-antigen/teichoic acid export membrane protein
MIWFYRYFSNDSLYRNSIYLMLSTAVMAFFGFFFWIICARLFNPEQVGIATTLISVMTLISTFSILGLGNSLIKYLPTSNKKNEAISTSLTLVSVISIFISIIYLIFLNTFTPKLLFLRENPIYSILFILFIVVSSLNIIFENIFIAHRSSIYVLFKNTIFSIIKLVAPFTLVTLGAYGIFISFGLALFLAFIFSLIILMVNFNYKFKPLITQSIVNEMAKFSLGNYIAGFTGMLPFMVLPILILNTMGAKLSAYFYMDMMIANFLYIIPLAVSQSLFAEGSYSEIKLKIHLRKAIRMISIILVPGIIAILLFGNYFLSAFGKNYSKEGFTLLAILALSGIFISTNYIGNSILYIKHRLKAIFLVNFIGTIIILFLSTTLIHQKLLGIGIAWIIGQVIVSLLYFILFIKFDSFDLMKMKKEKGSYER